MRWLAVDIGGANLKAADGQGYCSAQPFPLWKRPHDLAEALRELLRSSPTCDAIAATMTGELADCFRTKREGVRFILTALNTAAEGRSVGVYLLDGQLATVDQAMEQPLLTAASNWHVLARFAGRYTGRGAGLLIDIGSTTCDIIPLIKGYPAAQGATDPQRLVRGELVYTGVERSPVCAVVRELPWRGARCPVAQELFSTTWDAYLMLGHLPEEPEATHTADGRPATGPCAHDRLARSICADREMFSQSDALAAAAEIQQRQLELLEAAASKVIAGSGYSLPTAAVISGQGEFLARRLLERLGLTECQVSLSRELGNAVSRCATAHALAVLAREELL